MNMWNLSSFTKLFLRGQARPCPKRRKNLGRNEKLLRTALVPGEGVSVFPEVKDSVERVDHSVGAILLML